MAGGAPAMRRVPIALLVLVLTLAGVVFRLRQQPVTAQSSVLSLNLSAQSTQVDAGGEILYTLTLSNSDARDGTSVQLEAVLPDGFSYVSGSAELAYDGASAPISNPTQSGQRLQWSIPSLPGARAGSVYGMHTFVQDKWADTGYQLDRVRELMGQGAYVKQLCYRITPATTGPNAAWVSFVNGCYDRGLVPVIRLAGEYDGGRGYWVKPEPPYSNMAEAFKRVVAGLPRRDGHQLYIEIWNEPNLDLEWSGSANPVEYGQFLVAAASAIRSLGDSRIVLMNGGLSPGVAYSAGGGYDWLGFIDAMATVPGALNAFDVWSSHVYPGNRPPEQNLHAGNVSGYRELAIDSYQLELERLALRGRAGVKVLITETGYALGACDFCGIYGLPQIGEANRADYMVRAYQDWWRLWPEVLGVCPYQLKDPHGQWAVWDWLGHQQYDAVRAMGKSTATVPREVTLRFRARAGTTAGTFSSSAAATTANLGSVSGSGLAPVTVRVTPTPTPVPPGQCVELLQDGGFEQSGWQLMQTAYNARYTTSVVRSGQRALQTGILDGTVVVSYSSAQQTVQIPQTSQSVLLEFWYWPMAESSEYGLQYVAVMNEQGVAIEYLMWLRSNAQAWQQARYDLSRYAGQTITLRFGAYNAQGNVETGLRTALLVDDASLRVCGAAAPHQGDAMLYVPHLSRAGGAGSQALTVPAGTEVAPPALVLDDDRERALRPLADMALQSTGDTATDVVHDSARNRLVTATGDRVLVWDLAQQAQLWLRRLPAAPYRLAIGPNDGSVYATVPQRGEVHRFSSQGQLVAVAEGLGRPTELLLLGGRLWVAEAEAGRLTILDATTLEVVHSLRLPGTPGPLAYVAKAGRVYVTLYETGSLLALDAASLEPLGLVHLGGVGLVSDLVASETTGRVYATHALSAHYGGVSVVDGEAATVTRTVWGDPERPMHGANALVIDSARDQVILRETDGVRVFQGATLEEIGQATGAGYGAPGALALDLASGTVYLSDDGGRIWTYGFADVSP